MLERKDKILIAGAQGMVGNALVRIFQAQGYHNLLIPTRQEVDYTNQQTVTMYMHAHKPDIVVIAAAKVGGIWANMSYPAEFIYNNLMIACNLIHTSHQVDVKRLLFLGSSCIYPRDAQQPISEEFLLTGPLEKTNEAYALAKIAGVKLCQFYRQQFGRSYIAAMPTNLYGPYDHYHPQNSHVIPGLLSRFHEAKINQLNKVPIWGTGKALREFLYVDDAASACVHLLKNYNESSPINIGSEDEVTIQELATLIAEVVDYKGEIINDYSKPDGTPRKKTDIKKILSLGWRPTIPLNEGLKLAYEFFLKSKSISGCI